MNHHDKLGIAMVLTRDDYKRYNVQLMQEEADEITDNSLLSMAWNTSMNDSLLFSMISSRSSTLHICKLNLSGCEAVTNVGCSYISHLKNLTKLSIGGCNKIDDEGLSYLLNLTEISHLEVDDTSITNNGLHSIVFHFKKLVYLNIADCEFITDDGLNSFRMLNNLLHLNISGCPNMTDVSLAYVCGNSDSMLLELLLEGTNITDNGLKNIFNLRSLRILNMANCHQITDKGLGYLTKNLNLTYLDLFCCYKITDYGLSQIALLPKLEKLDIRMCPEITSHGLSVLSSEVDYKN